MTEIKYAGIGAREAIIMAKSRAHALAAILGSQGFTLSSGGAIGMDKAFEAGCSLNAEFFKIKIYRPDGATPESIELASKFHPAWERCNPYMRQLHGRNAQIILGRKLDNWVKFVLYWSKDPTKGGTSLGLKIAAANDIPCYNILKDDLSNVLNGSTVSVELKKLAGMKKKA